MILGSSEVPTYREPGRILGLDNYHTLTFLFEPRTRASFPAPYPSHIRVLGVGFPKLFTAAYSMGTSIMEKERWKPEILNSPLPQTHPQPHLISFASSSGFCCSKLIFQKIRQSFPGNPIFFRALTQ